MPCFSVDTSHEPWSWPTLPWKVVLFHADAPTTGARTPGWENPKFHGD